VNTNGTWVQNSDITGSLMIRPVFGSGEIVTGVEEELNGINVYPNPSAGEFYVKGEFDQLHITTVTGLPVAFTLSGSESDHKVNLNNPTGGLYILRIQKGERIQTEKIIVR
jgi:hypothetical protein